MAYSIEFKEKVVNEFRSGKTITEVSDKYKIAPSTVFFWNKFLDSDDNRYKTYNHKEKEDLDIQTTIDKLQKKNAELSRRISKLEKQINKLIEINDKLSKIYK